MIGGSEKEGCAVPFRSGPAGLLIGKAYLALDAVILGGRAKLVYIRMSR